jgi:phosphoribosylanthranilate isomerase
MKTRHRVKVKICGVTNLKDAKVALKLGAWALGFNFYKKSPRYISPQVASQILKKLPKSFESVGIFVNSSQKEIERITELTGISMIQLHGSERPLLCSKFKKVIKAFKPRTSSDLKKIRRYSTIAYILIDSAVKGFHGGTGKLSNWALAKEAKKMGPVILAGGLNDKNVSKAISAVKPFAVDVTSGVEFRPGVKSTLKLKKFFAAVKRA